MPDKPLRDPWTNLKQHLSLSRKHLLRNLLKMFLDRLSNTSLKIHLLQFLYTALKHLSNSLLSSLSNSPLNRLLNSCLQTSIILSSSLSSDLLNSLRTSLLTQNLQHLLDSPLKHLQTSIKLRHKQSQNHLLRISLQTSQTSLNEALDTSLIHSPNQSLSESLNQHLNVSETVS